MTLYRRIIHSPWVPWRLRHPLERWVETRLVHGHPHWYQRLHFGTWNDPLRAVTHGPRHHFFGYYDKSPWNAPQTLMLCHEVDFNDRPPSARDEARICVIHLQEDNRLETIASTRAWNWQQGAMLRWHPADPENTIVFNERQEGALRARVLSLDTGETRIYGYPVYAIHPDGSEALTLNFARLATHRPGYGYAGVNDPGEDRVAPGDDGLRLLDLESGDDRLLVSLAELAAYRPHADMADRHHWINHAQYSPAGERFAFFHLWRRGGTGWGVRLYTMDHDGSHLRLSLDADFISHYDWLDERRLLVWARDPETGGHFFLLDVLDGNRKIIGPGVLTEDGHPSYSPDRRWILNDTYPDVWDMRTLMLFRPDTGRRIDLARTYSPKARWWGEIRCDLHPRWSPDGRWICIDSVHTGQRQIYVAQIAEYLG